MFLVPFTIFGLFWYIRNYLLRGNPFYPGRFLMFPYNPAFNIQGWMPIKTIFFLDGGLFLYLESLISEFLVWSLLYLTAPFLIIYMYRNKLFKEEKLKILFTLGYANFILYLLSPSWYMNTVSDLRYLYPSIIPLIMGIFLLVKQNKLSQKLYILVLLSAISVLPQISFRPKIILFWLMISTIFLFWKRFYPRTI